MSDKKLVRKTFQTCQGRRFEVAYCKIEGRRPGPTLTLIAGQHGMEHIGPIMLRELIDEISPADFCGTLFVCPCANPPALEASYEIYPETEDLSKLDNYHYARSRHYYCVFGMGRDADPVWFNMNRLWQRDRIRGVAGEITQWLWNETCREADVIIDFHCLQAKKPLIYSGSMRDNDVARYFGIEAIHMLDLDPDDFNAGNLAYQGDPPDGRYSFCVEFSRQHELKEEEYAIGKAGIGNVMKAIGMADGEVVLQRPVHLVTNRLPLSTDALGHIHYRFREYDPVGKDDVIFDITSIETLELLDRVTSPVTGIMGRRTYRPVSKPGERVCSVCETKVLAQAGVPLPKLPGGA